jgi:hypothetical protein
MLAASSGAIKEFKADQAIFHEAGWNPEPEEKREGLGCCYGGGLGRGCDRVPR